MTTSSGGSSIIGAAWNALLLWISIYVVTTHLLIWIRWDVVQPDPIVVEKMVEVEVPVVKKIIITTSRPVDPSLLQRHEELIEKLKQAEKKSDEILNNEMKKHQATLALLLHNLNHPPKLPPTQATSQKEQATSLSTLSILLTQLHQPKDPATIEATLEETLAALVDLAARNATIDWTSVQDFFSHQLPKQQQELMKAASEAEMNVVDQEKSADCRVPSDLYESVGVTKWDLNQKSKDFKLSLKERTSGMQALLGTPNLLDKIQDYIDAMEDDIVQDGEEEDAAVEETTEADGQPARVCIQPEDVKSMVKEALKLVKRNANPGPLLVKRVKDLDPGETNLIMDAPLRPPDVKLPTTSDASSLNMRQVLEQSPVTRDMIQLTVDGFIDFTSGHVDWLDQWVDGVLETSDGASVGQVFVRSLMDAAGYVQIPIPIELQVAATETKAGVLSST